MRVRDSGEELRKRRDNRVGECDSEFRREFGYAILDY